MDEEKLRQIQFRLHDRLAVARKMVCYLLAVERGQRDFVPAEKFTRTAAA
jgi:hypothetical protein